MHHLTPALAALSILALAILQGCACSSCADPASASPEPEPAAATPAPPPAIQAWMDSLTIDHEYDPATGFIVAREVIALPPVLANAPRLPEAVAQSAQANRPLIVFATADRCAPCQQYKKDALTDQFVIARLSASPALATHIEVDREPDAAEEFLGSRAIPMTYLLRDGAVVATLRGQRSAADLLDWLDEHNL